MTTKTLLSHDQLLICVTNVLSANPGFELVRLDVPTGELTFRVVNTPSVFSEEELEHMKNHRKIMAIKCVRARTNCSLEEAKKLVDSAMDKIPW